MGGAARFRGVSGALDRAALAGDLVRGAAELNVALDDGQRAQLLDYLALLVKWNGVYNLTAIRDPHQMLVQHLLDSLAIIPHLAARLPHRVLDVGSGGGLPGIVLAIAQPAWQITLNDIVHKKTAFLTQVRSSLGLNNVTVITGRVEQLRVDADKGGVFEPYDAIVSRAFADTAEFVGLARHLLAPNGVIWAMKGVYPEAEVARLPTDCSVTQAICLKVPMLDAERNLLAIEQVRA